ncbi:acyltransferase [Vibrio owensii]|uniref:acyltransferase n=1 Tax=Vibrio owensii TaxID=696485 RepID=UPI001E4923FB|nr:acyltransferase [Vibrio owensii]
MFKIFAFFRLLILSPFMQRSGFGGYLGKPLHITRLKALCLGNRVRIYPLSRIEILPNGYVDVGDEVSIGQSLHLVSGGRVTIGGHTTISANVFISDVDHDYSIIGQHILEQPLRIKPTSIGSNSFIGYGAVILPGTILGKNCIVGANAVVRGKFEDYSVIAGNPGRVIKKYDQKTGSWFRINN